MYRTFSLLRLIPDYLIMIFLGTPLGIMMLLLIALGRIKVKGYRRAIFLLAQGNVIIAANHPSMLETILIPLIFFPWFLLWPRLFLWSMPDRRLLPPYARWLFRVARCITIDRSEPTSTKPALKQLSFILQGKGNIIVHPEAGRTFKGMNFLAYGDRHIRNFISGIPSLARLHHTTILPLWVSGTDSIWPVGTKLPRFTRSNIYFSFGTPYTPDKEKKSREEESTILAQAILTS